MLDFLLLPFTTLTNHSGLTFLSSYLPVSPTFFFAFFTFVLAAILLDFWILKKEASHEVGLRKAVRWSIIWIAVSLLFNIGLGVYHYQTSGAEVATTKSLEFFTAYVVEKSLSVDNLFVFLTIFTLLKIPSEYQKKVILIGVSGAVILRTIMVFVGLWLITQFAWLLYVFGALLALTGVKILYTSIKEKSNTHKNNAHNEQPALLGFLMKYLPLSSSSSPALWVKEKNKYLLTAVGLASIGVIFMDAIFAVDSIPAVMAISQDPYIVLTSNILAILGLRALYFVLADLKEKFWALGYGLGVVLVFIGLKMGLSSFYHMPPFVSLAVIVAVLSASIWYSVKIPESKTPLANV